MSEFIFFFSVLFANESAVRFYTPPGQTPCVFQEKQKQTNTLAARRRSDCGPTAGADTQAVVSQLCSSCLWGFGIVWYVGVGKGDETHRDDHEVRDR